MTRENEKNMREDYIELNEEVKDEDVVLELTGKDPQPADDGGGKTPKKAPEGEREDRPRVTGILDIAERNFGFLKYSIQSINERDAF